MLLIWSFVHWCRVLGELSSSVLAAAAAGSVSASSEQRYAAAFLECRPSSFSLSCLLSVSFASHLRHTWFRVVGSMQAGILNSYCGQQMAIFNYFHYMSALKIPHSISVFSPFLSFLTFKSFETTWFLLSQCVFFNIWLVLSADSVTDWFERNNCQCFHGWSETTLPASYWRIPSSQADTVGRLACNPLHHHSSFAGYLQLRVTEDEMYST